MVPPRRGDEEEGRLPAAGQLLQDEETAYQQVLKLQGVEVPLRRRGLLPWPLRRPTDGRIPSASICRTVERPAARRLSLKRADEKVSLVWYVL